MSNFFARGDFVTRGKRFANRHLRPGRRTVLWTDQQGLGFGNFLYLWLQAHVATETGRAVVIRHAPGMDPWLERFPALGDLTVRDHEVKFSDKREWAVNPRLFQRFDVDYSGDDIADFSRRYLLPILGDTGQSERLVLNIRRGDYYSNPQFRVAYGMDIVGYVEEALKALPASSKILVVSDDEEWCRAHLGLVLSAHAPEVTFAPADPWANFQAVTSARRLIGTNSSFSYWGGYVSRVLDSEAVVVMPRFHKRTIHAGRADQLDPTWTIIEDLPGGWGEKG